jgi:HEAT repeat protein
VGFCNVLAQFKDARAVPALLQKWAEAPAAAPGDRYIPDALAALGDRSAVAPLAAKMKSLRMDYRVHIAHALGILGGEEAVQALRVLAAEDPSIAVRGEAQRALRQANP